MRTKWTLRTCFVILLLLASSLCYSQEQSGASVPDFSAQVVSALQAANLSRQQKLALMPVFQLYDQTLAQLQEQLTGSEAQAVQLSDTLEQERKAQARQQIRWQMVALGALTTGVSGTGLALGVALQNQTVELMCLLLGLGGAVFGTASLLWP